MRESNPIMPGTGLTRGSSDMVESTASRCDMAQEVVMVFGQQLAWHSVRIVLSMGQVLSQLDLKIAEPLRRFAAVLSFDVGAQLYRFECHGFAHDYYRAWWLNTVGQLAGLLLLVALWYAVQRVAGSTADEASARASSTAFFVVFLWCHARAPA